MAPIWGKKTNPEAPAATAPQPAAAEKAPSKPPVIKETLMGLAKREEDMAAINEREVTVVGKGTEFEGKLTFEGEVRIAGKFSGEIFSKDRLQVDPGAKVQAEIQVGSVIVYGEIVGNIRASQVVDLKANARVKGNIETPALVIEKGCIFEGTCKMEGLGKPASVTPISGLKPVDEKK